MTYPATKNRRPGNGGSLATFLLNIIDSPWFCKLFKAEAAETHKPRWLLNAQSKLRRHSNLAFSVNLLIKAGWNDQVANAVATSRTFHFSWSRCLIVHFYQNYVQFSQQVSKTHHKTTNSARFYHLVLAWQHFLPSANHPMSMPRPRHKADETDPGTYRPAYVGNSFFWSKHVM